MSEYSTDEINTGVPDLVARCTALEAEVALLHELAAAAAKAAGYLDFISRIAGDLEWGLRQRALGVAEELHEALRRVDAEAGDVR